MTNVKSAGAPPPSDGVQGGGASAKKGPVRSGGAEMISHQALVIDESAESEASELMWRIQTLPRRRRRNHSSSTLLPPLPPPLPSHVDSSFL